MNVEITIDCFWILNADKNLFFLQTKHLRCGRVTFRMSGDRFPAGNGHYMALCGTVISTKVYIYPCKFEIEGLPSGFRRFRNGKMSCIEQQK